MHKQINHHKRSLQLQGRMKMPQSVKSHAYILYWLNHHSPALLSHLSIITEKKPCFASIITQGSMRVYLTQPFLFPQPFFLAHLYSFSHIMSCSHFIIMWMWCFLHTVFGPYPWEQRKHACVSTGLFSWSHPTLIRFSLTKAFSMLQGQLIIFTVYSSLEENTIEHNKHQNW